MRNYFVKIISCLIKIFTVIRIMCCGFPQIVKHLEKPLIFSLRNKLNIAAASEI